MEKQGADLSAEDLQLMEQINQQTTQHQHDVANNAAGTFGPPGVGKVTGSLAQRMVSQVNAQAQRFSTTGHAQSESEANNSLVQCQYVIQEGQQVTG